MKKNSFRSSNWNAIWNYRRFLNKKTFCLVQELLLILELKVF